MGLCCSREECYPAANCNHYAGNYAYYKPASYNSSASNYRPPPYNPYR